MNPKNLLSKYNLHPIKKWGQNFLNNKQIIEQIIGSFEHDIEDGIIEIGPGLGILTEELVKISKKVVSIEIDKKLATILLQEMNFNNLVIINDDFLNIDLLKIIKVHFKEVKRIHIVANLPYYLTSPILFKLFDYEQYFASFTLMMQKEVAERIISLPNNKSYNNISVISQYLSNIKISLKVNRHNFFPQPNVDSWVLNFTLKQHDKSIDIKKFMAFVRDLFSQKRKTLLNNLINIIKDRDTAQAIIINLNWPLTIRSEQLTIEQFIKLYHFVNDSGKILKIKGEENVR